MALWPSAPPGPKVYQVLAAPMQAGAAEAADVRAAECVPCAGGRALTSTASGRLCRVPI